MNTVVLDASALVEYLLGTHLGVAAAGVIEHPASDLHAPGVCDVEVASALRGLLLAKKMTIQRADEALADATAMPITRHGHGGVLSRVLELRDNFSAYDATYVALAEALDAALLTCDEPLATSVAKHLPRLRLAPAALRDPR